MSSSKLRAGFLSEMQRYPSEGWIAGVCEGIADYFGWKAKLVRLAAFLLLIFTGFWPALIAYAVLWYLMDEGDRQAPRRPHYDQSPPEPPRTPGSTGGGTTAPRSMGDLKDRFADLEQRLRGLEECVTSRDFELRREIKRLES